MLLLDIVKPHALGILAVLTFNIGVVSVVEIVPHGNNGIVFEKDFLATAGAPLPTRTGSIVVLPADIPLRRSSRKFTHLIARRCPRD